MWVYRKMILLLLLFNSVLHPFQDYFSSNEMGQSVGRRKRENPEKKKTPAKSASDFIYLHLHSIFIK